MVYSFYLRFLFGSMILLSAPYLAYAQSWVWAQSAGGNGTDRSNSIATDNNGNSYITGSYSGAITFGSMSLPNNGGWDIFVAKYNSSGDVIWAKSAGEEDSDYSYGIATDNNGNCYVTGEFSSDSITFDGSTFLINNGHSNVYVVKYDDQGNVVWAKSAGGNYEDTGYCISADNEGNCYVGGSYISESIVFGSTTLTGNTTGDLFVVKYDPSGNVIWANNATSNDWIQPNSISVDSSGNCYVVGAFINYDVDFGNTTIENSGSDDFFIAKYNSSGNVDWVQGGGGNHEDNMYGIATDENGFSFVIGTFESDSINFGSLTLHNSGEMDGFIAKYDSLGNVHWASGIGGESSIGQNHVDRCEGITIDSVGNSYVTGYSDSDSISFGTTTLLNDGPNSFVAKFNASGNPVWAKYAGLGTTSIDSDGYGNCYVTGNFNSDNMILDSYSLSSIGSSDVYIAKLSQLVQGLEEFKSSNTIVVYPNPTTGRIQIDLGTVSNRVIVNTYSVLGKLLHSQTKNINGLFDYELPAQNGVYIVQLIHSEGKVTNLKVVKE